MGKYPPEFLQQIRGLLPDDREAIAHDLTRSYSSPAILPNVVLQPSKSRALVLRRAQAPALSREPTEIIDSPATKTIGVPYLPSNSSDGGSSSGASGSGPVKFGPGLKLLLLTKGVMERWLFLEASREESGSHSPHASTDAPASNSKALSRSPTPKASTSASAAVSYPEREAAGTSSSASPVYARAIGRILFEETSPSVTNLIETCARAFPDLFSRDAKGNLRSFCIAEVRQALQQQAIESTIKAVAPASATSGSDAKRASSVLGGVVGTFFKPSPDVDFAASSLKSSLAKMSALLGIR